MVESIEDEDGRVVLVSENEDDGNEDDDVAEEIEGVAEDMEGRGDTDKEVVRDGVIGGIAEVVKTLLGSVGVGVGWGKDEAGEVRPPYVHREPRGI